MKNPNINYSLFPDIEYTELHCHLGGATQAHLIWKLAHKQGMKLPMKNYWDFRKSMIVKSDTKIDFKNFHDLFYWTEYIQSGTMAMEESVYSVFSGAYRKSNIKKFELSFNPMLRNLDGKRDLDHIILSAITGMQRAMIEFEIKGGLIFLLDKRLSKKQNMIILDKAIKYKSLGVVGIDIAGPSGLDFDYTMYSDLYNKASENGLGTIAHLGEDQYQESMLSGLKNLKLNRVIHGINGLLNKEIIKILKEKNIHIALCPTVNVRTDVVKEYSDFLDIINILKSNNISYSINTDNPAFLNTSLTGEFERLLENNVILKDDIKEINTMATEASFVD